MLTGVPQSSGADFYLYKLVTVLMNTGEMAEEARG